MQSMQIASRSTRLFPVFFSEYETFLHKARRFSAVRGFVKGIMLFSRRGLFGVIISGFMVLKVYFQSSEVNFGNRLQCAGNAA